MDLSTTSSELDIAARYVRDKCPHAPEIALVLGSGLGDFADTLEQRTSLPYAQIPGMLEASVEGHAGNLVLGTLAGRRVAALQGRVHLYEGHAPARVVFGVRLLLSLGAKTLLLTNAAGGIRSDLGPGTLMLIEDHLNLTGHSPLRGGNDARLGPRFPDMTAAYDRDLLALCQAIGARQGMALMRGVYAGVLGPSYETPAEIRMLRAMGADAVGMSTVLETIAARHMGARCLALSCITNLAAGLGQAQLNHEEVQETARATRSKLEALLRALITELPAS